MPETSGRRGLDPVVHRRVNASDEARAAAQWLLDRHDAEYAWRDMVLLAPGKRNWRDPIVKALNGAAIPHRMLLGDPDLEPDFAADHVHVMTMHAVQELEFPVVAILGIGDFPWKSQSIEEATRLVYVAMTRATHALSISWSKQSALVARLIAA